jgi:hypothetical protein
MHLKRLPLTLNPFSTLLLIALMATPAPADEALRPDPHIVVIGEVQGAANTVTAFLEHLDLIDSDHHWSGGDTVLIQTGDLMDGGENVRNALDLFIRLQSEAASAGGQIIVLMGNHEAMNILGELRDVNYLAYQSFVGSDSEARQKQAWEDWVALHTRRAKAVGESFEVTADTEADWFAIHPPGWVEYVESMRPDGIYGAWLRSLPVAVEIDDVLFIHGGIGPEVEEKDVDAINRRAQDEIQTFDKYRAFMVDKDLCLPVSSAREMTEMINQEIGYLNTLKESKRTTANPRVSNILQVQDLTQWGSWSLVDDKGPLWFRGAARWPEEQLTGTMDEILTTFDVERIVTGQSDGKERLIRTRFDNRVLLTSIDMDDNPYGNGGKPAALEIMDGDYFVVTLGGRELLIDD